MQLQLSVQPEKLAICRLPATAPVPAWAKGPFVSVTRTADELSVVCEVSEVTRELGANSDWRAVKVEGLLDFSLTGILASLANPLARAGVSLFAVSTFDTDYILVKDESLDRAVSALENAGFTFLRR